MCACEDITFRKHSYKEIYFVKTKQARCTCVLAKNKLFAMSVLSLLGKDHTLVYLDVLTISTQDINLRIPLNLNQ